MAAKAAALQASAAKAQKTAQAAAAKLTSDKAVANEGAEAKAIAQVNNQLDSRWWYCHENPCFRTRTAWFLTHHVVRTAL